MNSYDHLMTLNLGSSQHMQLADLADLAAAMLELI